MERSKQNTNVPAADLSTNFSFDTIQDFDTHISKSIPNYIELSEHILKLASYFIKGNNVIDIGCSTGLLLDKLAKNYKASYVGFDIADNLLGKQCDNPFVTFHNNDIRYSTFGTNNDLVLSIFTLQFINPSQRKTILARIYESLNEKGALIISEKCIEETGFMQDLLTFAYYDYKQEEFSASEILGKQIDLRTIMRPITCSENEELFKSVGFKEVYQFWQSLNFRAWICIK